MPVTRLDSACDLPEADWQRLATGNDPFMSRAFLGAAEQTGAAGEQMAWRPMHLVLRDQAGRLAGLLPLYLRGHSFGDFSRDWNWAAAWQQNGRAYYPKLVTGVPYTPSPGPRLLAARVAEAGVASALVEAALALIGELGASSWQCLFVREAESQPLRDAGLLLRRGVQFHWLNRNYRDFADFLDGFTAQKRKKVKRERRAVAEAGLCIELPVLGAQHVHVRGVSVDIVSQEDEELRPCLGDGVPDRLRAILPRTRPKADS